MQSNRLLARLPTPIPTFVLDPGSQCAELHQSDEEPHLLTKLFRTMNPIGNSKLIGLFLAFVLSAFSAGCVGVSVVNSHGYKAGIEQLGDLRIYPHIQGRIKASENSPVVAYGFQGPPYRAGVKVIDLSGRSITLTLQDLTLRYADSRALIFQSSKPEVTFFGPQEKGYITAECHYNVGDIINPKDSREIRLDADIEIVSQGNTVRHRVSAILVPSNQAGVGVLEPIHH